MKMTLIRESDLRGGILRRLIHAVACGVVVLCVLGCVATSAVKSGPAEDARSLELPEIAPPERWTLDNGMTVLFAADPELPLVSGSLFIRGGSLWESMEEFGLAAAVGAQLRLGGAGDLEPEALDERLDELSASISSSIGQEFGRVQFSSLSADLEEVFRLFSTVVREPRFDKERLDLWVSQAREGMRRRIDDPSTVAVTAFNQVLFGRSPYGWALTERDLDRFTRARIRKTYERFFQPSGALLAITGRASRQQVEALVERYFGSWQASPHANAELLGPVPVPERLPAPRSVFVELPLQQATIIVGQRGVGRLTPDHLAIELFNNIYGAGGFGSRLMKRVRSDAGLAYSVYGVIAPAEAMGKNFVFIQTKVESAGKALVKALDELMELRDQAPSQGELDESRAALLNSFIFRFDSPGKVLVRKASFELLGYPSNYDERYIPGVRELEPKHIQAVARERWSLDELSLVVVGSSTALESVRDALGARPHYQMLLPLERGIFDQRLVLE
jgi:zinc protease